MIILEGAMEDVDFFLYPSCSLNFLVTYLYSFRLVVQCGFF